MDKPTLRGRARGLAVVRKGTLFVAAAAVAGTGAFAAIQAKAYEASHPDGGTQATGSEGVTPQNASVTQDNGEHDGHDGYEQGDDQEEGAIGSFSPPATAPADAGGSTAGVVSGGS